jgi:hypothetical protein
MDLLQLLSPSHSMFEDERFIDTLLVQERMRRIQGEGPPTSELKTITHFTGLQYKMSENGKIWSREEPCTICDENECLNYLIELSERTPVKYIYGEVVSICNNPLNNNLLHFLCAWRKHVKETFIIKKEAGEEKWKRTSICTSELTFLGRSTEQGGILGILSKTEKHICSLPTLVSLMDEGVKCLSIGFALLITMYMDWDLYTEENAKIVERLLKKVRKAGKIGLDTYCGTPWGAMFKCILERRRIPDKLKELIMSRAHLP